MKKVFIALVSTVITTVILAGLYMTAALWAFGVIPF